MPGKTWETNSNKTSIFQTLDLKGEKVSGPRKHTHTHTLSLSTEIETDR